MKHLNLVSNKLIRVEFLPQRDNQADVSIISLSSLTVIKLFDTKF